MHYYSVVTNTDYISHHGVKGQRWGVRKYQNEDGTWKKKAKKSIDDYYRSKELQKQKNDQLTISGHRKAARDYYKHKATHFFSIRSGRNIKAAQGNFSATSDLHKAKKWRSRGLAVVGAALALKFATQSIDDSNPFRYANPIKRKAHIGATVLASLGVATALVNSRYHAIQSKRYRNKSLSQYMNEPKGGNPK